MHEDESLGQYLKRTRITLGYDIPQMVAETRISTSNLTAIEDDDYASLPADAFCRGFYAIYAKALGLDAEEIVGRYRAERGISPRKGGGVAHNPPAHKAAKQVGNMATPAGVSPLSTIGYVLLLLIILTGGVCWYFNINPATYLSEKLRSFQEGGEVVPPQPQETEPSNDGASSNDVDSPAAVKSENIGKLALNSGISPIDRRRIPLTFDQNVFYL